MTGRSAEALEQLDLAAKLAPHAPPWYWAYRGLALFQLRRYQEALAAFQRTASPLAFDHAFLAACHAMLDQPEEAHHQIALYLAAEPGATIQDWIEYEPYRDQASLWHFVDALRRAGLPERL